MRKDKKVTQGDLAKGFSMLTQVGFIIVSCVGVSVFIGIWLDRWLGTAPWLLLVFSFLGVAAAFKSMYDYLKKM